MQTPPNAPDDLATLYRNRFQGKGAYRNRVWRELCRYFQRSFIPPGSEVLELGAGYGEFINNIEARRKLAMDLNPDARARLGPDVELLQQDVAAEWPLPDNSVDVVFTSNFLEHLSGKPAVERVLRSAHRCLRPGGRFIGMGPNIKCTGGRYWDFWDHQIPLTDRSLAEVLQSCGFTPERVIPRFLPFTMSDGREYPPVFVRLYLAVPAVWRWAGQQFLVTATK